MYYYDKKRVLVVDPSTLDSISLNRILENYQATQLIKSIEEIESTWALNKVPVFLGTEADLVHHSSTENDTMIAIPKSATYFSIAGKDPFIEFCHSHGIECGEYVTGKHYNVGDENCFLCRIANALGSEEATIAFNMTVETASDIVIYETQHFLVKIEYGCLTPGMLMICTKKHYTSIANIPDELFSEYWQVCRDMEDLLKNIYGGPVTFFEHGSAPDGGSSHKRSIVHQHVHLIPGIQMDKEDMERVGMKKIQHITEVRGKKYLSYQVGCDGHLWVSDNPNIYIPRQYPRKVFACKMGISYENSNWRTEPFWQNIYQTFDDIHRYLAQNWTKLDRRVQNAMRAFFVAYPMR